MRRLKSTERHEPEPGNTVDGYRDALVQLRALISESRRLLEQSREIVMSATLLTDGLYGGPPQETLPKVGRAIDRSGELPEGSYLRFQALRCRKIAEGMNEPELIRMLCNMALEFEYRAANLEPENEIYDVAAG
jgi:hypothetical protein